MRKIIECRDKFVSRSTDIVGHVAFSLYMESRIEHHDIEEISEELFEVPVNDVKVWKQNIEDKHLFDYRKKFIDKELPGILERYRDTRLEKFSEATINAVSSSTGFWKSVLASVVGWLISIIIITLAYVSLDYGNHIQKLLSILN